MDFVINSAGRGVPTKVNGRDVLPFAGINKPKVVGRSSTRPIRRKFDYPDPKKKVVPSLSSALEQGMTILYCNTAWET